MSGALVEGNCAAVAAHQDSCHADFGAIGIEARSRAAGSRKDAAPVGVGAGEGCLHEWRSGDRPSNPSGGAIGRRAADVDFDDALRAFAIRDDLQSERSADGFKSGKEFCVGPAACTNRRSAGSAIREERDRVVRGSVTVNADGIECFRDSLTQGA